MIRLSTLLLLVFIAACGNDKQEEASINTRVNTETLVSTPDGAEPIPMEHTETFTVHERDGYKIVDLSAPFVSWGGQAQGSAQTARVILVPKGIDAPPLVGDLANSVVVRTPVERIATNYGFLEGVTGALGINSRLVAVGGVKSFDDDIRARARNGELAKVGYGWHSPPDIAPLLESRPDVFLMVLGGLGHAEHYERIKEQGVPVVPIFFEAETSYMGPVDYVRLVGMMVNEEREADEFVSMVANNVSELKRLVSQSPQKRVLSSWYAGSSRWMVTVRNADNRFITDAGGINVMQEADDTRIDDFKRVGTEVLLDKARDIDCWIIRDPHSSPFNEVGVLKNFKAWRDGCLFAFDGMTKPEADSYDIYQTGLVRPDLILGDMVRMLHPELRDDAFVYLRPDAQTVRP